MAAPHRLPPLSQRLPLLSKEELQLMGDESIAICNQKATAHLQAYTQHVATLQAEQASLAKQVLLIAEVKAERELSRLPAGSAERWAWMFKPDRSGSEVRLRELDRALREATLTAEFQGVGVQSADPVTGQALLYVLLLQGVPEHTQKVLRLLDSLSQWRGARQEAVPLFVVKDSTRGEFGSYQVLQQGSACYVLQRTAQRGESEIVLESERLEEVLDYLERHRPFRIGLPESDVAKAVLS